MARQRIWTNDVPWKVCGSVGVGAPAPCGDLDSFLPSATAGGVPVDMCDNCGWNEAAHIHGMVKLVPAPPTRTEQNTHSLERTSPKGGPFIGRCRYCGVSGVPMSFVFEPCASAPNPDQQVIDAVESSFAPPTRTEEPRRVQQFQLDAMATVQQDERLSAQEVLRLREILDRLAFLEDEREKVETVRRMYARGCSCHQTPCPHDEIFAILFPPERP